MQWRLDGDLRRIGQVEHLHHQSLLHNKRVHDSWEHRPDNSSVYGRLDVSGLLYVRLYPQMKNMRHSFVDRDNVSGRTLTMPRYDISPVTIEDCTMACEDKGYLLAGVEYGSECCASPP